METAIVADVSLAGPGAEDREQLFPDVQEISNTMDITRCLYTIRETEKRIAYLKVQDQESRAFYQQRIAKSQDRIEQLKQSILNYLEYHGMRNIQTPVGTAYKKQLTTRIWPADDLLLEWCQTHKPDAIRIKREPDKRLLSDHIKATGEIPDGYTEEQKPTLCIK